MSSLNLQSKFLRMYSVVTDAYGIDPFSDLVVPEIQKIVNFTTHEVTQDERGAPDLIALREYGDDVFWWHIMSYNGVCRVEQIVQGVTLRIPNLGSIVSVTNKMFSSVATTDNIVVL